MAYDTRLKRSKDLPKNYNTLSTKDKNVKTEKIRKSCVYLASVVLTKFN